MAMLPEGIIGRPHSVFVGDMNTDLAAYAGEAGGASASRPDLLEAGVVIEPGHPTCTAGGHHRA